MCLPQNGLNGNKEDQAEYYSNLDNLLELCYRDPDFARKIMVENPIILLKAFNGTAINLRLNFLEGRVFIGIPTTVINLYDVITNAKASGYPIERVFNITIRNKIEPTASRYWNDFFLIKMRNPKVQLFYQLLVESNPPREDGTDTVRYLPPTYYQSVAALTPEQISFIPASKINEEVISSLLFDWQKAELTPAQLRGLPTQNRDLMLTQPKSNQQLSQPTSSSRPPFLPHPTTFEPKPSIPPSLPQYKSRDKSPLNDHNAAQTYTLATPPQQKRLCSECPCIELLDRKKNPTRNEFDDNILQQVEKILEPFPGEYRKVTLLSIGPGELGELVFASKKLLTHNISVDWILIEPGFFKVRDESLPDYMKSSGVMQEDREPLLKAFKQEMTAYCSTETLKAANIIAVFESAEEFVQYMHTNYFKSGNFKNSVSMEKIFNHLNYGVNLQIDGMITIDLTDDKEKADKIITDVLDTLNAASKDVLAVYPRFIVSFQKLEGPKRKFTIDKYIWNILT